MNRSKKLFYLLFVLVIITVGVIPSQTAYAAPPTTDPYEVATVVSNTHTGSTRIVSLGVLHDWQQFPAGGAFTISNSKSKGITITNSASANFFGIISASFGVSTTWTMSNSIGVVKNVTPTPWARFVAKSHEKEYLIKIRHDIHINSNTIIETWYSYHYVWKPIAVDSHVEYSSTGPY